MARLPSVAMNTDTISALCDLSRDFSALVQMSREEEDSGNPSSLSLSLSPS